MGEYLLNNTSWIKLSNDVFIKKINKTMFLHDRVGIPKKFSNNFGIDNSKVENKIDITLKHKGEIYSGYLEVISYHRTRMLWHNDFTNHLKSVIPDWEDIIEKEQNNIYLRFKKTNNLYDLEIIDLEKLKISDIDREDMFIIEDVINDGSSSLRYISRQDLNELIILYHGLNCKICGFNFKIKYGQLGEGLIEIFKTKKNENINKVDFKKDYTVLCSNCKLILDRNNMKYEELFKLYKDE